MRFGRVQESENQQTKEVRRGLYFFFVSWLVLVACGISLLVVYSQRPGEEWVVPENAILTDQAVGESPFRLVLFLHPNCTCSRATLGELETLMMRTEPRIVADVRFVVPAELDDEWAHGGLWDTAQRIPGVKVSVDKGGVFAGKLGATTSGATALFDEDGELIFQGGITAARGHFGDNVGRLSIESFVNGESATTSTPVYGCLLSAEAPASLSASTGEGS